jgi:hypothetical protein
VYEATPRSRDVEAREREESGEHTTWSDGSSNDEEEGEMSDSERRRAFVETLNQKFGGKG